MLNCCIVTAEFSGVNASGGIGTAARGLARQLQSHGCLVDILITDLGCSSIASHTNLSRDFNIVFMKDVIEQLDDMSGPVDAISESYAVYWYLRCKSYAVVHFNDWKGSGFYCAMAKRQGLFESCIVTHLHGCSEWVRRHNNHFPDLQDFERESIERSQIENSDLVISPSEYLLQWYRSHGVSLPQHQHIGWFLPQWFSHEYSESNQQLSTKSVAPESVTELIFFGRHERRKGFELFVDAVARLPAELHLNLTFIGRFDRVGREFTGSHVFRRLPRYAGRIRFFNQLNQDQAVYRILHSRNALCVMPSIIENSPCVVGECFTLGVPFLATDVGGTSELIDPESRHYCLVEPEAPALAEAIQRVIREGLPALKSTLRPQVISGRWRECFEALDATLSAPASSPRKAEKPLVSICVTHYERPALLRQAISRLMAQTYDNIEIIIVDDGSRGKDALAYLDTLESEEHRFPLKVIRSENKYLGAARNLAASHARGSYLLFHDDDNLSEEIGVDVFVKAALHSGCDVLTSQYWVFGSDSDQQVALDKKKIEYFPIGIGGAYSFFRNRFGDANALFKREVFESLGGFSELRGVGWEDWELFLRAFVRGFKMGIVPEPLFNYRVNAQGMLATGNVVKNYERLYAMVDEELPRINSDLLRYAQRDEVARRALDDLWSTLGKAQAGDLHRQLLEEDPNSEEARIKLSDLAFAIGRMGDAIELGISNFQQREKLLGLVPHLSQLATSGLSFRQRTYVSPDTSGGTVVAMLRGWAFIANGQPFVPDALHIDRDFFQKIAHRHELRPDVNNCFSLPLDTSVGFIAAAKQSQSPKTRLLSVFDAGRRLPYSTQHKIRLVGAKQKHLRAHIDEVFWCREVSVLAPEPGSWNGAITVEGESFLYALLKIGDSYSMGQRKSSSCVKFLCPPACLSEASWSFVLPHDRNVQIIFE